MDMGTATVPGAMLIGRDAPWAALRDAMETASGGGRALWLCGEAGMGKSALLEQAVAFAADSGLRVLRVSGAEQEADLAFGVLHQLVRSLSDEVDALVVAQRLALERALGTEQGRSAGGLAVAAATLALLTKAATKDRPLFLVVDDLQWVDPSSAEILAFVQRRLATTPIILAAGVRKGRRGVLDSTGAQLLDLAPLTDAEAVTLLDRRHPELTREARNRLVREAAGNPLALVELPAQLDHQHRTGRLPLPEDLPLGERLEHVFAERFDALDPPTRHLLLLCALAGREEQPVRLALEAVATSGSAVAEAVLEAAEKSGLIHLHHTQLTFVHPLVRACLVRTASAAERRRAHRALAAALPADDERRVTHLAAAAIGTDDELAGQLERAAGRMMQRGGHPEAATLLTRAARLTSHREARGSRLTAAAQAASIAGQMTVAAGLLEEARTTGTPARDDQVLWDITHAYIRLQRDGDLSPAAQVLPAVLPTLRRQEGKPGLHDAVRFLLHLTATCSNRQTLWDVLHSELPHSPPLARLCFDVWSDPSRRGHGGAERLQRLVSSLAPEQEHTQAWPLLWTAAALDCVGDHTQLWHRLAQQAPCLTQAYVDVASCLDDYLRGRWERSLQVAGAGASAARERGCGFHEQVFRHTQGFVHAGRGRQDDMEAVIALIEPWARERGQSYFLRRITGMRATCALTLDQHEKAFTLAAALTPPGTFPAHEPHFHHVFLDLVESAVETGRRAMALAHVAAGRHTRMHEISPHHALVLAAADAITAEGGEVHRKSETVYAMPDAGKWPFALGRVHLRHGRWLRRNHRPEEAREQLRCARAQFTQLEAEPWMRKAAEELRAAGTPVTQAQPSLESQLTPQELRIAQLVASGLTNGQIADRLKVSPRTVATHLYKIFPKANVSSRAALAHAVRSAGDEQDGPIRPRGQSTDTRQPER